jgi:vanillate O-demethylase ferredoxin subunit
MDYLVSEVISHGSEVKEFRLRHPLGLALQAWQAGAHLKLHLPGADGDVMVRHYSMIGMPGPANEYRIAVLRDANSRGGSLHMHEQVRVGQAINIDGPFNSFNFSAGNARTLLIGGGIGITPLVSMAYQLEHLKQPFELHYLARSRERMALLEELQTLSHATIYLYSPESGNAMPNLAELLGAYSANDAMYACGPVPLLNALRDHGAQQAWPLKALHFESFGARVNAGDKAISVHLAQTGVTIEVSPGVSILDALIEADVFVAFDCKRGECGNCYSSVLEGAPEHRDVCLTPAQRAQGMCTCVSWNSTERLVLDL